MCLRQQTHVLRERAAERDVENLTAPAHSEDRQVARERGTDERELEGISLRLGGGEQRMRVLAIARRLDVPAGGEHDPVDLIERRLDGIEQLGQRQWHRAGEEQRALHTDAAVVAEVMKARGHSDQRTPRNCKGVSRQGRSTPVEHAIEPICAAYLLVAAPWSGCRRDHLPGRPSNAQHRRDWMSEKTW